MRGLTRTLTRGARVARIPTFDLFGGIEMWVKGRIAAVTCAIACVITLLGEGTTPAAAAPTTATCSRGACDTPAGRLVAMQVGAGSTSDGYSGNYIDQHTNSRHHSFWSGWTYNQYRNTTTYGFVDMIS